MELCTARLFERGPIPYPAIVQYAQVRGMTPTEFEDLRYFVGVQDAVMLKHWAKQMKKKGKKDVSK